MTETMAGWTRIGDGGGSGPVLAIDFYGTGRKEATFRDLVKLLPERCDMWQTLTPPDPAMDHLAWWSTETVGEKVQAVLGYCSGGVFASALADEIERHQGRRPTVVLFNPDTPTVNTLSEDFEALIDGMTALEDEERTELRQRAREIRELGGDDLETVGAEYVAAYRKTYEVLFERLGIPGEVGNQLTQVFGDYVRYLIAARRLGRQVSVKGVVLTSREYGTVTAERAFDLARAELLGDREVAVTLHQLITKGR